jgi:oligopeptidase A
MSDLRENPLLDVRYDLPFDRITAEHVVPAIDHLIERARGRLQALGDSADPPTYSNTLAALEDATDPLERAMSVVSHLESVVTTDALRAAYNEARPRVSELYASIPLDERLYWRLAEFARTYEAATLSPTRRRFLDKTLREMRRHGAELDPAGKQRLRELDVELAKLTTRFSQNLLDDTNAFELYVDDEAALAGLPASARDAARASAEEKGRAGYRFTLHAPSLMAVLTYLDDGSIREQVWRAYNTRASSGERDNRALIERILELRREKARLLGFRDFADFVLEERMAKRGEVAVDFVRDLSERSEPFFARERAELDAFRAQLGVAEGQLAPWDVGYFAEKLRKARFDFDDEALRPYFSVDRVLDGLFVIAERLYGVRVAPREGAARWHPSVRAYELVDEAAGGRLLGGFYVDLFPRESKRGGAWMSSFVTGGPTEEGAFAPHLGLFCANVTPPIGGQPALLTHAEVETLFHEFGHLLHHCLSEVEVRSLAGTSVAWDFVELPSQIMENWTWERAALDLFARHHETREPIPVELLEKLQRARTYRAASAMMRQLGFAHTDLALHVEFDPATHGDAVRFARERMERFSATSLPDEYAMICGFTHLFGSPVGYAAGYYSYKWAEVLDADAFTRFRDAGVLSADVGRSLRETIFSRGDSADPEVLFRAFLGRPPNVGALLERSGLVS